MFPNIGYCQEMKQVSNYLLNTFKTTQEALNMLINLLGRPYYLGELWKSGLFRLNLAIFQLNHLLKLKLPYLARHFKSIDLILYDIVTPWILTAFTCFIKKNKKEFETFVNRFWDIYIIKGWSAIISGSLALLYISQDQVIGTDLETTLFYYKKLLNSEDIYKYMKTFDIDQTYLNELEGSYFFTLDKYDE